MKIIMRNLQTCEDVTLEILANITNVLVAESETGKSVAFKGFIFLSLGSEILGGPKRRTLIRRGTTEAYYAIQEEDVTVGVKLYPAYEIYFYKDSKGYEEWTQNHPPTKILDFLGIVKYLDMLLNLIDKRSIRFLLGPDLIKSGELLKQSLSSNILTNFVEKLEKNKIDLEEILRENRSKVKFYQEEEDKIRYTELSTHKRVLEEISKVNRSLSVAKEIGDTLSNFRDNYKYVGENLRVIESNLNKVRLLESLKEFSESYRYNFTTKVIEDSTKKMNDLINYSEFVEEYNYSVKNKLHKINKLLEYMERTNREIDYRRLIIRNLKVFKDSYRYSLRNEINKIEGEMKEIKVCPTCGSDIN